MKLGPAIRNASKQNQSITLDHYATPLIGTPTIFPDGTTRYKFNYGLSEKDIHSCSWKIVK